MVEQMTANEYQKLCMRTAPCDDEEVLILQGVMGACGEAGEAIEVVKKHKFQGHELDSVHLVKELGDILWYIATCAEGLGATLEEVMEVNIEKLRNRYPDRFDPERSIHRKEGDI